MLDWGESRRNLFDFGFFSHLCLFLLTFARIIILFVFLLLFCSLSLSGWYFWFWFFGFLALYELEYMKRGTRGKERGHFYFHIFCCCCCVYYYKFQINSTCFIIFVISFILCLKFCLARKKYRIIAICWKCIRRKECKKQEMSKVKCWKLLNVPESLLRRRGRLVVPLLQTRTECGTGTDFRWVCWGD